MLHWYMRSQQEFHVSARAYLHITRAIIEYLLIGSTRLLAVFITLQWMTYVTCAILDL